MLRCIIFSYILPISLHERNFNPVTLFPSPCSSSPALLQSIKDKIFKPSLSGSFHRACRVSCSWPRCVVFISWHFTGMIPRTLTSRTHDLKCWELSPFTCKQTIWFLPSLSSHKWEFGRIISQETSSGFKIKTSFVALFLPAVLISVLLGLQRLIKMHWLFCSFIGESTGFPRARPITVVAGPVIHVLGLWVSPALLFCVEWRWCAEWRYRQTRFTVPVFQEQRCSTCLLSNLLSQQIWLNCLSSELQSEWRVWLDLHANQNVQHCCA